MKSILIYGGSFDPPHNAHLLTASAVNNEFSFDELFFLPCKKPVLKSEPLASPEQRVEMLRLAINDYKNFRIDLREINRDTPSYMVDTLRSIRNESSEKLSITLLIGTDALLQLPQWHRWEELMALCNLLVIKRRIQPGEVISPQLNQMISTHLATEKSALVTSTNGLVYFFNAGQYNFSSSLLREMIKNGEPVEKYIPYAVEQYIKQNHLYQSITT